MAGAILRDAGVSLFVASALFGTVAVSLFVVGAVFADVAVSLFVASEIFADVAVSLFVAGAVLGEIWVDSRRAKCCIFQYKCRGGKRKLCERTGSVFQVHARIMFGSCSNRPRIVNDASAVFRAFLSYFGMSFFVAGAKFGEGGACCPVRCQ